MSYGYVPFEVGRATSGKGKDRLMFWLENTRYAKAMWKTVPEKNVDLGAWRRRTELSGDIVEDAMAPVTCGTIACFGGWVAAMPRFVQMGVQRTSQGGPAIHISSVPHSLQLLRGLIHKCPGKLATYDRTSSALFGERQLFESGAMADYDELLFDRVRLKGEFYSDHEIVEHRLERHEAVLVMALEKLGVAA